MSARVATSEAVRLVKFTAGARPGAVYTAAECERAALLVDGVWRAGQEVGVVPTDWAAVASLGHECLDAVRQSTMRAAARAATRAAAGGSR